MPNRLRIPRLLFTLLFATIVIAQDVAKELSFGYDRTISPNSFGIPGFVMLGENHTPQLLSDKVILTPPYGGNKRGALWSEAQNTLKEWTLAFEFRAGGQDRSSGSIQLWYVTDGKSQVSASSVYTVGRFDGLALLVDTHGGTQSIRGFLNDGSTDYRNHPNVDSLPFGHCDYNYRNLGRPSKIQMTSSSAGFAVTVDDRPCFSSDKVALPTGYNFGVSASSSEPPDSFEVFKFVVKTAPSSSSPLAQQQQQQQQQVKQQEQRVINAIPQPDDLPASQFTTSQAQFEDLHSRLYLLSKSITNLFTEITRHTTAEEQRYQEILRRLPDNQAMSGLDARLQNLDRLLSSLERELKSGDHKGQFAKLSEQISQTHLGVSEHLPNKLREYVQDHTPRIGFIVFSFIGFQCVLVLAYVTYKRRRAQAPKKYL